MTIRIGSRVEIVKGADSGQRGTVTRLYADGLHVFPEDIKRDVVIIRAPDALTYVKEIAQIYVSLHTPRYEGKL